MIAALSILALVVAGAAQNLPLVPVPAGLPVAVRTALGADRAKIDARIVAYNVIREAFNVRCARVPNNTPEHAACGADYASLMASEAALIAEKNAFAAKVDAALAVPCTLIDGQLERDMDAMRRQQRTVLQGVEALEELAERAEAEKRETVLLGVKVILEAAVVHGEAQARSAAAYQGWMTRHREALRKRGVKYDVVRAQLDRAIDGYLKANTAATIGMVLDKTSGAAELWEQLKQVGEAIGTGFARGQASVREALSDPSLVAFALEDATLADLGRTLLDIGASANVMKKISPQYTIAAFLVDAGFQFAKFDALRAEVMQRHALSDEMLKAVTALKLQIERTVKSLKACKATG